MSLQKSASFAPAPIVEEAFDGLTDEERRRIQGGRGNLTCHFTVALESTSLDNVLSFNLNDLEVMNLAAMDESMMSSPFAQPSTLIKTDERLDRPVSPSLPLSPMDIQGKTKSKSLLLLLYLP